MGKARPKVKNTVSRPAKKSAIRIVLPIVFASLAVAFLAWSQSLPTSRPEPSSPSNVTPLASRPVTASPAEPLAGELRPIAQLIRQRNTVTARNQVLAYLAKRPKDAQAIFLLGLTFHREQKYGQATPYYEQALEIDPNFSLINHFYGWALYYLGDLPASRQAFESFLVHQPDEPDSLFALGLIDLDEDNLDDAAARFRTSIAKLERSSGPPDVKALSKAHARLGETLDRQGDLKQAKAELEIATRLFPDHYEAFYKLYRVLVRLDEKDEAARVHNQYLIAKERVRPGTSFPE
jgi:tetratricopeptide (TPR) repeat protein